MSLTTNHTRCGRLWALIIEARFAFCMFFQAIKKKLGSLIDVHFHQHIHQQLRNLHALVSKWEQIAAVMFHHLVKTLKLEVITPTKGGPTPY